jgi:hypothetical protein
LSELKHEINYWKDKYWDLKKKYDSLILNIPCTKYTCMYFVLGKCISKEVNFTSIHDPADPYLKCETYKNRWKELRKVKK